MGSPALCTASRRLPPWLRESGPDARVLGREGSAPGLSAAASAGLSLRPWVLAAWNSLALCVQVRVSPRLQREALRGGQR